MKSRADVVGIFPNEASIRRLIGAVLYEQNNDWHISSRPIMPSGHPGNYTSLTGTTTANNSAFSADLEKVMDLHYLSA